MLLNIFSIFFKKYHNNTENCENFGHNNCEVKFSYRDTPSPHQNAQLVLSELSTLETASRWEKHQLKPRFHWVVQLGLVRHGTLHSGTLRSGLHFHCRTYPFLVGVKMKKYFTSEKRTSRNSCTFYKVFQDPIISKMCHYEREANANELSLMFRYFTTVHVRYVFVTNKFFLNLFKLSFWHLRWAD